MYLIWKISELLKKYHFQPRKVESDFSSIFSDQEILKESIGNNSFLPGNNSLTIPAIISGNHDAIACGKQTVFREIFTDEVEDFTGLENYVFGRTETTRTPIFVCDNHNQVLKAWQLIKAKQPQLIHIDQHKDDAIFKGNLDNIEATKICDYIDFAIQNEWIQPDYLSFTENRDLQKLDKLPNFKNHILNIDLDLFAPECTIISLEEKIEIIAESAKKCQLITLATSPGFIKQELACEIAKLLWKTL